MIRSIALFVLLIATLPLADAQQLQKITINYATRTLIAEIDVDNPTGKLLSGAYTEVHLKVPGQPSSYLVPVSALIFRAHGLQVAVVKNGAAVLMPVTPGRDYGEKIEIMSGLQAADTVIVSPPDSLVSGQKLQVVQTDATTTTGGAS